MAEGELLMMAVRTPRACTVIQSEPFSQTCTPKTLCYTTQLQSLFEIPLIPKTATSRKHQGKDAPSGREKTHQAGGL